MKDLRKPAFSSRLRSPAVAALRLHDPRRLVLAVPTCASRAAGALRPEVDELVCLEVPDEGVVGLLERAGREQGVGEVAAPEGRT